MTILTIPDISTQTLKCLFTVAQYVYKNKESQFYKDHLKNAHIKSLRTYSDWQSIPFLTRETIIKTSLWQRTYLPRDEIFAIRATSGTSGGNALLTPRKIFGNYAFTPQQANVKRQLSFIEGWYLTYEERRVSGCVTMNMSYPKTNNDFKIAAQIAKKFQPDSVAMFPNYALALAPYFKKAGILKGIKSVELYGERCSSLQKEKILEVYNNPIINGHYGLSEVSGILGVTCPYTIKHKLTSFHLGNEKFFLEFINPDTNNPQSPTSPSELVISSLTTDQPFPVIKYKTGDLMVIDEKSCPCGKGPRFKITGRVSERARMDGIFEISLLTVENAVYACRKFVSDEFEAHYYYDSIESVDNLKRPRLHIRIKTGRNTVNENNAAKLLSKNLMVGMGKTYLDKVLENQFSPLTVEYISSKEQIEPRKKVKFFNHTQDN